MGVKWPKRVPAIAGLDLERIDAALHTEEAGFAPERAC